MTGNILATRVDSRGYRITCTDHVDEQTPGAVRHGTFWITSPDGETVRAGYWMDWPESDMADDEYYAKSREERADLNCWYQTDRYDGLACQVQHKKFGAWIPMETFEERFRARFMEVWRQHPYMSKYEIWRVFFPWVESTQAVKRSRFLKSLPKEQKRDRVRD